MKRIIGGFFCALFLFTSLSYYVTAREEVKYEEAMPADAAVTEVQSQLDKKLYATSAVLMDADTGRVLYGKNADVPMAMASTTKIMTCILLLEYGNLEDELQVSAYAASMPKVKLYINAGETYRVKDLLHSLMLESHNDAAVALAEYIGKQYLSEELKAKDTSLYTVEESKQAVAAFAALMNQKAVELGCENTYFITPNGLDATETITETNGEIITKDHHTTAEELARIMSYCITDSPQKDKFIEITRTPSYGFSANGRSFSCINHNSFLNMMDGALSGKTGFTNKAGYCYVGALERDGKTFVIALLACGWPNHKSWKWSDSRELFSYGLENFEYRDFSPEVELSPILVTEGAASDGNPYHGVSVKVEKQTEVMPIRLLTGEGERVVARMRIRETLEAPVAAGTEVGVIEYYLVEADGSEKYLAEETVCTVEKVEKIDFRYLFSFVFERYGNIFN